MSTNEKHLPQLPTPELMQQAAENLLRQRVLNKGGRQPSEQTVKIAAKVMAARAMRELGSERDRTEVVSAANRTATPRIGSERKDTERALTPAQQAVKIAAKLMAAKRERQRREAEERARD